MLLFETLIIKNYWDMEIIGNGQKKSFVPKKKLRHVTIRDFKNKKI